MRQIKRRQSLRLIVIFLCVALGFSILWGITELVAKIKNTVDSSGVSVSEIENEQSVTDRLKLLGVPINSYDADGFTQKNGRIFFQDEETISLTGVDVSAHQGEIDWQAVAADGVDFTILRVGYRGYTEGQIQADERFEENLRGALEAGLRVGVYFFSQAITPEEAEEEAQFVIAAIDGCDVTLPVLFDWEEIEADARTDEVTAETLTSCAERFCQTISGAGYSSGLYFNQLFGYQKLDLASLKDYSFWLAEYHQKPTFWFSFDLWQYSNSGTVAGIDGNVDLNLLFVPKSEEE